MHPYGSERQVLEEAFPVFGAQCFPEVGYAGGGDVVLAQAPQSREDEAAGRGSATHLAQGALLELHRQRAHLHETVRSIRQEDRLDRDLLRKPQQIRRHGLHRLDLGPVTPCQRLGDGLCRWQQFAEQGMASWDIVEPTRQVPELAVPNEAQQGHPHAMRRTEIQEIEGREHTLRLLLHLPCDPLRELLA